MNLKTKLGRAALISTLVYVVYGAPLAFSATVGEIAQELVCTCGCNMLVSACEGTMECSAAANIKDQIVAKLNSGQSKDEIIAFFVNQHGEQILSAPTKRGFNLTAWILPFVAVLVGIGVVYLLLKRWASRRKPPDEAVFARREDDAYLQRVESELQTFDS